MRSLVLAAVAAFAFASVACDSFAAVGWATGGAGGGRAYQYDAHRRCRDEHGHMCAAPKPQRHCDRGRLCGATCLPRGQVCRRPRPAESITPPFRRPSKY